MCLYWHLQPSLRFQLVTRRLLSTRVSQAGLFSSTVWKKDCGWQDRVDGELWVPHQAPSWVWMRARVTHLSWEQCVGVELAQLGHKRVVCIYHILHEAACQHEPVGATVHHDAGRDLPFAQAPHVRVTFMEEPVQALFLDEPVGSRPAKAGGCVGWSPGCSIHLGTNTPPSVIGLEAL